jgi:hypothetical protein
VYLPQVDRFFWLGNFPAFLDIDQYGYEIVKGITLGELRQLIESEPVVATLRDGDIVIQGTELSIFGDDYAIFGLIVSLVFVVPVQLDFPSADPIYPSNFQLGKFSLPIVPKQAGRDGGSFPINQLQFHQFGKFADLADEFIVRGIVDADYYLPVVVLLVELRDGLVGIVPGREGIV